MRQQHREDPPLENVKPAVGMRVRLRGEPGIWQITGKAPDGAEWWCGPVDDAARQAPLKPRPLGAYRAATYRDMRPHNHQEFS